MQFIDQFPLLEQIPDALRFDIVNLTILFAVFVAAWILRQYITRLLLVPVRALTKKTSTKADDFFAESLSKFVPYIILSLPLFASIPLLSLQDSARTFVIAAAWTLVIYAIFRFLYELTSRLLTTSQRVKRITGYDLQPALMPLVKITGRVLIIVIGLMSIAQIWGWNVAGLVTGVGLGGLAISLAAKDILDDVLGYAVIIGDNIFREDEYIVSPSGEGIVETIGVRSTQVRQLNQGLVTIPNAKLSDDWVTNWSRLEKRWFNFMVGITYHSTAGQIKEFVDTLTQRLKEREHVQDDSVVVLFTEYDESSLNVLVRAYVDLPDWVDAHAERHNVNLVIMQTLGDIGLEVAFPSRSLYLDDMPAGLAKSLSANNMQDKSNSSTEDTSQDETQNTVAAAHQTNMPGDDDTEVREKEESQEEEGVFE